MIVEAFVLPRVIRGITDASTTRRPSIPYTRSSLSTTDPIAQVEVGWYTLCERLQIVVRVRRRDAERGALHRAQRWLRRDLERHPDPVEHAAPILVGGQEVAQHARL